MQNEIKVIDEKLTLYFKYFQTRHNKWYTKYTKQEIYNLIDVTEPNTFIPFLEEMDYPYFEREWGETLAHRALYTWVPLSSTLGVYINKMRLSSFKNFTFKDSKYHKDLTKFSLLPYGIHLDEKECPCYRIEFEELL